MSRNKPSKNEPTKSWLILLGLAILVIFASLSYINYLKVPVNPKGQVRVFVIQKGESISSVAQKLERDGFIRSAWFFKYSLKRSGKQTSVAAGDFKLSSAMSMDEIIRNLVAGPVDKWVTLIEGLRVEEMAQELNEKLKIPASRGEKNDKFIKAAKIHEGYLFPDTYLFNSDATAEDIVSILRVNFDKKYTEEIQTKIKKLGLTPHQGVILASIVEREARTEEPRRMAASILLKRLKIGMGLQADATIQYILGYQKDEKSFWKRHLTKDDLKVDSSFNTYLYAGLPPGPICNPSLMSLEAVANADSDTPYLYYYHDSKGDSHYAKTLEEHNQNIANNP